MREAESMEMARYDCNCDNVIAMEEMGVGIQEILQYARAVLPREEVRAIVRGLEEILECEVENEAAAPAAFR